MYGMGSLLLFIAPLIILIIIAVLIFFNIYDRYAVTRLYRNDKKFRASHLMRINN